MSDSDPPAGAAAGTCPFALNRQPLRRSGQPEAGAPDSGIRVAAALGEWPCFQGNRIFRHIQRPEAKAIRQGAGAGGGGHGRVTSGSLWSSCA